MILQPIIVAGLSNVGKWTFGNEFMRIIEDTTTDAAVLLDETALAYDALQMCGAKANTPVLSLKKQLTKMSIQTGSIFDYFDLQIGRKMKAQEQEEASDNLTMYVIIQSENPSLLEASLNRLFNSYIGDEFKGKEIEIKPILSVLLRRKTVTDIALTNAYNKMEFGYKFDISEGKEHTKEAAKGFYDLIKI